MLKNKWFRYFFGALVCYVSIHNAVKLDYNGLLVTAVFLIAMLVAVLSKYVLLLTIKQSEEDEVRFIDRLITFILALIVFVEIYNVYFLS